MPTSTAANLVKSGSTSCSTLTRKTRRMVMMRVKTRTKIWTARDRLASVSRWQTCMKLGRATWLGGMESSLTTAVAFFVHYIRDSSLALLCAQQPGGNYRTFLSQVFDPYDCWCTSCQTNSSTHPTILHSLTFSDIHWKLAKGLHDLKLMWGKKERYSFEMACYCANYTKHKTWTKVV